MTNKELSIILRLRDEATKRLEGVRGNLQRFANAWNKTRINDINILLDGSATKYQIN